MYFSQRWRLGSLRSRCRPICILIRALFLACRLSPSPCVLTWLFLNGNTREWRERRQALWHLFFYSTNPFMRAPPWWPHLTVITSQRLRSPNIITVGVKASKYAFWGNTNIQATILYIFRKVFFFFLNLHKGRVLFLFFLTCSSLFFFIFNF